MENTIIAQRKYFNERLDKIEERENPEVRHQRSLDLYYDEDAAELAYRSGLTRGKIIGLGLEKHMEEIVDGMNITCGRVIPSDFTGETTFKHAQEITREESDAFLQFGLDYIDKFAMYNELFGENGEQ